MIGEAAEDVDEANGDLPADARRAVGRLGGGQLGRKPQKLTRRSHMPRAHAPKRRTRVDALVTQSQWEAMVLVVLVRAENCCERCGRHGSRGPPGSAPPAARRPWRCRRGVEPGLPLLRVPRLGTRPRAADCHRPWLPGAIPR